ncbi:MAG: (2Fe-2S) ferredoxin domain-containing protein [Deltaproteobacteria bacterium]|nr:(2Fe-2S) ferredoxin domain-containing protein [Deltaproteobacteria bacterium]
MARFQRHAFVCENERDPANPRGCCKHKGGTELRLAMKKIVDEAGLKGCVRVNVAGCLDACENGPVVVIYPEGIWYTVPTPADAEEVAREHLVGGRVVDRLLMQPVPEREKKPAP